MLAVALATPHAAVQRPSASFLDADPVSSRLTTRHLEAVAAGGVQAAPDGRAMVVVQVTPAPKMHVYAADVAGYVPFSMAVTAPPGITAGKVTYPPSETYVFPPTGESSRAYMQPFVVKQAITVDAATRRAVAAGRPVALTVTLRYQACDDRVCYRPASGTLRVELTR